MRSQLGNTALIWAASEGRLDCLQSLLTAGSRVDSCNSVRSRTQSFALSKLTPMTPVTQSGRTALHWAISNGRDDVLNALLANGASIELTDEVQCELFVLKERSLTHSRCSCAQRDYTALLVAAECGNTYALHKLRAHGANPRAVTDEGHDALLLAAIGGHEACLADLLEWGRPPKVRQYEKPWSMNANAAPDAPKPERMDVPSMRGQSLVVCCLVGETILLVSCLELRRLETLRSSKRQQVVTRDVCNSCWQRMSK